MYAPNVARSKTVRESQESNLVACMLAWVVQRTEGASGVVDPACLWGFRAPFFPRNLLLPLHAVPDPGFEPGVPLRACVYVHISWLPKESSRANGAFSRSYYECLYHSASPAESTALLCCGETRT